MGDTALACFGRIPWIDSQGARRTTTTSDDVDDDGDSDDNDANDNDGGDGDNDDGEVEHDGGDDNDNDDDDDVNIDVVEDDDDDGRWDDDNEMATRTNGRRRCDGDGRPATRRTLASAAPPIQGNNQLMSTVWGGVDKREGQFRGGEDRKGSMWRRLSGDHFISTQSIPNLPSGHPSAEKGPEPIPHVSWE